MEDSSARRNADHVIILVHGIRDFALWHTNVRDVLEAHGFKSEVTNYGRLNLIQFLVPISYFRKQAIDTVWKQIRIIKSQNPDARLSVIAHSFGTYVISHLMQRNFDIEFHRVIFCGSVVQYGFPFEQFANRFTQPIVNEVGTRDPWPAVAESITTGYGSAGTYGFRRPLVRDRWHNRAGHGYFLDATFCKTYWIPFLKDQVLVSGSPSPESPKWWIQLLSIIKLKYLLLASLVALLIIYVWPELSGLRFMRGDSSPSSSNAEIISAATGDWKKLVQENVDTIRNQQRQLDLTDIQLKAFFAVVGEQPGTLEEMLFKLQSYGVQLKRAKDTLEGVKSTNPSAAPTVVQATNEAKSAIDAGNIDKANSALKRLVWHVPNISVCWEDAYPNLKEDKELVRSAIRTTWEAASKVRFVGWNTCAPGNTGVRIKVSDEAPHTTAIGPALDGRKDGVLLNFTFQNWSKSCADQRELCIRATAVHEFGHVLGFSHEQNKADAPADCKRFAQGSTVSASTGPYDPNSVMNYCNPIFYNGGVLSTLDKQAIALLYGSNN